ncbi:hypothetical protein PQI51_03320 [Microbacterium esteraromaticum]|uniref:hypothetical protein n=1 Tax=Microbacterium esteraromaticum TaxID=57043 RepID=UPI0030B241ED
MPWFKVDDALAMHMKAFMAGNKALGLWVRAGSWSMHQLSDGFIPREVVGALGGDWDDAAALINAGLWHEAEGGYAFHDWSEYQPTREQVLAERAAATERKRRSREKSQGESRRDAQGTDGGSHPSPSRPVPTPTTTYVPESKSLDNRARSDEKLSTTEERMAAQFGVQPERVQRKVADQLGINLPLRSALSVAVHILSKPAQAPRTPMPYVLGAITRSPAEVAQYIHELGLEAA